MTSNTLNQIKNNTSATRLTIAMICTAIEVFEDEAAAIAWMRQPNRVLGDVAPLDLISTEVGAVSVRRVLNAIATGGVV